MNADVTPMNADARRARLDQVSRTIIGAAQRVGLRLGHGFLEKVYENALVIELRKMSLEVEQQRPVLVYYDQHIVGNYVPDLLVEGAVIVEIKAVIGLDPVHRQQCLNYLRATGHRVCVLLNFGQPRLEVRRLVWHF